MAAVPEIQTVTITVNDVELQVPKGELIVESVKRIGLEVPVFCYHPRMKPVGMCRMCLVEVGMKQADGSVRKMGKPQAACTLPASDNLVIYTDTEQIHKDRKGVLEFLLINHPLDCPICDRGGECPLQNNTIFYGPSTSRFVEMKRHLPKAFPLSEYVTLDLERCIQCGRCVRFTEEISGDSQLAFRFRGASMQPSTFQLTDFESKFSGNTIEICPVGALTSAKYRFRARPWDLETSPAIEHLTAEHGAVWFDHRSGHFVRMRGRTNEAVNEEWTSDKSQFGHEFYNDPKRLKQVALRNEEGFVKAGWSEAYERIVPAFEAGSKVAGLAGPGLSNEAAFSFQRLFREAFGSSNVDHRWTRELRPRAKRIENFLHTDPIQSKIADLEQAKTILIFGTPLAEDAPMSYLRARKAWFQKGVRVIDAYHGRTDAEGFAEIALRYKPGSEGAVAAGLLRLVTGAEEAAEFTPEYVEKASGVPRSDLEKAAEALKAGDATILATRRLFDVPHGGAAIDALAKLSHDAGIRLHLMQLHGNDQGNYELGVLPDTLPGGAADPNPGSNTREILEACARGEVEALWLAECDPFTMHPDRDLVERALENVGFLVVQGAVETESAHYASVILPTALPAEQDGTYTNVERRVQRMKPSIGAPGEAKPAWRVFAECMLRAKGGTPMFNPRDIMDAIAEVDPRFAAATYDRLEEQPEGVVLATSLEVAEVK